MPGPVAVEITPADLGSRVLVDEGDAYVLPPESQCLFMGLALNMNITQLYVIVAWHWQVKCVVPVDG